MIFRYSGLKCLYLITENKCTVVTLSGYLPHYLNIKVLEILAEENNTTQGDKGYINWKTNELKHLNWQMIKFYTKSTTKTPPENFYSY